MQTQTILCSRHAMILFERKEGKDHSMQTALTCTNAKLSSHIFTTLVTTDRRAMANPCGTAEDHPDNGPMLDNGPMPGDSSSWSLPANLCTYNTVPSTPTNNPWHGSDWTALNVRSSTARKRPKCSAFFHTIALLRESDTTHCIWPKSTIRAHCAYHRRYGSPCACHHCPYHP